MRKIYKVFIALTLCVLGVVNVNAGERTPLTPDIFFAMTGSATANSKKIMIYPKGLIKDAVYEIVERGVALRGDTIMNGGIELSAPWGDYQTYVLHLKKGVSF